MSEPGGLSLQPTDDPCEWIFAVREEWCAGPHGKPFLFGGVALAAAVGAMERSAGRAALWANAQYHALALPGTIIRLRTGIDVTGHRLTQARLTGTADDRLIITVQATLGTTRPGLCLQSAEAPAVAAPESCPEVRDHRIFAPGINRRFEFRLVAGDYPDGRAFGGGNGRVVLWVRALADHRLDRATLAIIADYISIATCDAMGAEVGSNSLDNTVRFVAEDDGPWTLAVIEIDAVREGIAHGGLRLFSRNGTLLAIAGTSLVVRDA